MKLIKATKLQPVLRWLRRLCRRRTGLPAPQAASEMADAVAPDDDAPRACGWFDSSHDLQQGLRVQEHLSADSLVRELPLGAWLDLQLSGWRTATPGAGSPAFTHAT